MLSSPLTFNKASKILKRLAFYYFFKCTEEHTLNDIKRNALVSAAIDDIVATFFNL